MTTQPEVDAKPIPVDTITLRRYGRTIVTHRSPVVDTEHFYFTVPKTSMQQVLDSLEVSDTRDDKPLVSFPAPIVTKVKPMVLKKSSAWEDLLKRHQGAYVELQTRSGPAEGYFLGFQRQADYSRAPSLILQTDGNICMYEANSISTIAFKDAEITKKFERYTSTLCRIHEQGSVYRIDITASGVGTGEVCASYCITSPFDPAFDFSYIMHDAEDAENNANNVAHKGRTIHRNLHVRCYAVIRNPLHYNIKDVHFMLQSDEFRADQERNLYSKFNVEKEDLFPSKSSSSDRNRSPVRRSPVRSRSSSPARGSPVRSPVPHSQSKTVSGNNQWDTESESTWDDESVSSYSTASWEANRYDVSREWVVPEKLSVKEAESVKVLIYESQMEGGLVHRYNGEDTRRAVMVHNTTDTVFEPGMTTVFSKGISVGIRLPSIKPGDEAWYFYGESGCTVESVKSSRRGEALCSRIVGKELVAKVMWYRKTKYLVHNKEDNEIDLTIIHTSGKKTGRDVEISAMFYPAASKGEEENEDNGEKLDRFSNGCLHWETYLLQVAPKQRCAVVVSEELVKLETYSILECSQEEIARLEQQKVVGPGLVEKLKELANLRRDVGKLKRTARLHRKRLDGMKAYERELATAKISGEEAEKLDGNKRFFDAVSAAEKVITEIKEALDTIEWDMVRVKGEIKVAKEEICDMKSVELGNGS